MSTIDRNDTAGTEKPDEEKTAEELAFEACEEACKTVELPSRHSAGEYRWHRLARMAIEKRGPAA